MDFKIVRALKAHMRVFFYDLGSSVIFHNIDKYLQHTLFPP